MKRTVVIREARAAGHKNIASKNPITSIELSDSSFLLYVVEAVATPNPMRR